MPVYSVIMSGVAVGEGGDYADGFDYEGDIDYDGTEEELAAELLHGLKEEGITLVRTQEMKDEGIDRIQVSIRSEGLDEY